MYQTFSTTTNYKIGHSLLELIVVFRSTEHVSITHITV